MHRSRWCWQNRRRSIQHRQRGISARGEPDDRTMTLLETCACRCWRRQSPRAVWLEADTAALFAEAGILRGSGDVMKHLENCPQAVLLAVTLGPGVDAQLRRAGVGDIAAGVASDALGSAWPSRPQTQPKRELRQWAAKKGNISPGGFRPATVTFRISRCSRWWQRAGHGAPCRPVRHRHQSDDPPQERDGQSGGSAATR